MIKSPKTDNIIPNSREQARQNNPSSIFTKLLILNCAFSNVTLAIQNSLLPTFYLTSHYRVSANKSGTLDRIRLLPVFGGI